MALQKIGRMSLNNTGLFVANIQFAYQVDGGGKKLSKKSEDILIESIKAADPGDLGVPDGATVFMHVSVVWGKDNEAPTAFIYEKGNALQSNYKISGTTLDNKLTLISVSVPTWKNWSENIVYNAQENSETYFYPSNLKDLQNILSRAVAAEAKVRVSGQRHSQPELVTVDNRSSVNENSPAWLVDMSCYSDLGSNGDQRMVMDPSGKKVTVNTGVREDDLDAYLTAHNRMMKTVTAGGFFSLGGMTAVDVHGATVAEPIFAETTSAFTIMGADGSVTTIDQDSPGEGGWKPIQFARVSLGALGIVTSVRIDVMDRPWATTLKPGKESYTIGSEEEFVSKFENLLTTHERIETFINPYSGKYFSIWWDIDPTPVDQKPNQAETVPTACSLAGNNEFGAPYEGEILEPIAEKLALDVQKSGRPWEASSLVDTAFFTIDGLFNKAVKAYSDLWLTKAARVIFMSYFIELPNIDPSGLSRAWKGLSAVTNRLNASSAFLLAAPMEFRFVRGGDTALASTYTTNPDATFINLDLIGFVEPTSSSDYPPELLSFFADIERQWIALGGMPHNGKMYGFYDPDGSPGSFTPPFNDGFIKKIQTRRKDRVKAFDAFRRKYDPAGMFSNEYVDLLLG